MGLLLYRNKSNRDGKFFEKIVSSMVKDGSFEIFHDFEKLVSRACSTAPKETDLLILTVDGFQELKNIVSIKDLLKTRRVILILPGKDWPMKTYGRGNWYPDFKDSVDDIGSVVRLLDGDLRPCWLKKTA